MNLAELFLGQIPEAVYFGLFLILTKNIKEKRLLFLLLMIVEYVLLTKCIFFNTWFQVAYTIMTFLTLKVLYKDKAQVTDVFTFGIASIILILVAVLSFAIFSPHNILVVIFSRLVLFGLLVICRNKLCKLNNIYRKLWNRNDSIKRKMKSTTFRSLNIVVFNVMFYIINLGMIYALLRK